MDWVHCLKTFLTVVETQNFSKASRALYKSPSAVSKEISYLEHYLKSTLLKRTTRKLELTSSGMSLYENAKKVLDELELLKTSCRTQTTNLEGKITLKAPLYFGEYFLKDRLAEFMSQNSEILLHVIFTTDRLFLKDEKVDIAIRSEEYNLKDKKHREHLFQTQRGIFGSEKYFERYKEPKSIADLNAHHCLAFSESQDKFEWILKDKIIFKPKGRLMTNNPHMMKTAIKSGSGLVFVSSYWFENELENGEIREVLTKFRPAPLQFYIEYEKKYAPQRVKKLVEFLKAYNQKT